MMGRRLSNVVLGVMIGIVGLGTGGCAVRFAKRSPWDIQQLQTLSEQLEQFRTLAKLSAEEAERLREAKLLLEQRLASQIENENISVGFDERGLVVRMLDQVLFDSGKAELRHQAREVLDQVARVLKQGLGEQPVRIEGHTDNEPIKHSPWKDNRELSLARARAVMEYLVQTRRIPDRQLTTAGFGEDRPIASNETPEGRQQNRRVEIVVLPQEAGSSQPSVSSGYTK